jgi:tRNA (guanine37-N1)-methyltransferase
VRESGCDVLLDVERVYFSVRLSTERLRLASLVTPGEKVLVLFSGAAPYVVILAKHSVASRVVGLEKNPVGHEYALHNLGRNKLPPTRAAVYEGDAAHLALVHEREGEFDRIIMMLPSGAKDFLGSAVTVANPVRCTLHVYAFGAEHEVPLLEQEIIDKLAALGWHAHVDRAVKAGHHKPFVYRWCFDVSIKKSAQ